MKQSDKILILGSKGMVGSAIVRNLQSDNFSNLLTPGRSELDLLSQKETLEYFMANKPDHVVLAAAKVGGIVANNTYRADYLIENLSIQNNVFEACFKADVDKLLFLGSSCIYPKNSEQPIREESLLTGPLEPTNEPYAIAKIAGLKLAENYKRQYGKNYMSVMPTNLFGENDYFHPEKSHVIPGLIARMDDAIKKDQDEFSIWGSGNPKREFLYVDDMAQACVTVLKHEGDLPYFLNVGTGEDISIKEVAQIIAKEMGFKGKLVFDTSKPDGMMRKLLDVSKIKALGWSPKIGFQEGIKKSIEFYYSTDNLRR